jgi:hypothetical protein
MDSSEVSITVVTCENCSYNRFTTATDRIFDASYREVDYQSEKGQQIMQKYDIRYVPGFVFSKNVEDAANYTGVAHQLVAFEDAYVLSDTGDEVAQRFSSGFSLNQSR